MYHFTIIDEASIENEQKSSNKQEKSQQKAVPVFAKEISPLPKASIFLYRYLDKNSGVRVFINEE